MALHCGSGQESFFSKIRPIDAANATVTRDGFGCSSSGHSAPEGRGLLHNVGPASFAFSYQSSKLGHYSNLLWSSLNGAFSV